MSTETEDTNIGIELDNSTRGSSVTGKKQENRYLEPGNCTTKGSPSSRDITIEHQCENENVNFTTSKQVSLDG